jgi:hypothetical protein
VAFAFDAICFSWTLPAMSYSASFRRSQRGHPNNAADLARMPKKGRRRQWQGPNQAWSVVGGALSPD